MIKIAVSGAAGRMGQEIITALNNDSILTLSTAIQHSQSSHLGQDSGHVAGIGNNAILFEHNLSQSEFDLLIEFAPSGALEQHLEFCRQHNKPMVIGSTGLTEAEQSAMQSAATEIPIVYAANMSVGVTLSSYLLATTAKVLGQEVDVDIVETHHKKKLDAPSGTALQMAQDIARVNGKQIKFAENFDDRAERNVDTINIASIRSGEVIGDHVVTFNTTGEQIEISHKASSRRIYAQGSLRAAKWLLDKPAGLYSMQQVLGLESLA